MTSSNVIEYIIFDKELNEVGRLLDNVEEQEGYFFTPEQLNEYRKNYKI